MWLAQAHHHILCLSMSPPRLAQTVVAGRLLPPPARPCWVYLALYPPYCTPVVHRPWVHRVRTPRGVPSMPHPPCRTPPSTPRPAERKRGPATIRTCERLYVNPYTVDHRRCTPTLYTPYTTAILIGPCCSHPLYTCCTPWYIGQTVPIRTELVNTMGLMRHIYGNGPVR